MYALCNSFSIAGTCCPMHGAWQEFSTDGLMALTATALLKALTVHLSTNSNAPISAALQQFHASKSYCRLSPSSPVLPRDLVGRQKSLNFPLNRLLLDIQLWEGNGILATLMKSKGI